MSPTSISFGEFISSVGSEMTRDYNCLLLFIVCGGSEEDVERFTYNVFGSLFSIKVKGCYSFQGGVFFVRQYNKQLC